VTAQEIDKLLKIKRNKKICLRDNEFVRAKKCKFG
jgi:hypothetical protein